jgi:hypothetical protein
MAAGRTFQHGSSKFTRNDFIGLDTPSFLSLDGLDRDDVVVVVAVEAGSLSSVELLLRFLGVEDCSISSRLGVIGLEYEEVGVYAYDVVFTDNVLEFVLCGSGLGLVYGYAVEEGTTNPGVIGIEVFVGLLGDSGLLSSLTPFKYVGLINGFEISIVRLSLFSVVLRRKSFFVENFRARLEPVVVVDVGVVEGAVETSGVGRSGVGRGYCTC